jgi:hypothetical protein
VDLPDPDDEDLDLALRHVTRQFPLALARALLPPGADITAAVWTDTQITSRQRRLDRALLVVANGERRFEHVEIQHRMRRDVPFRVFEYQALLALALAAETPPGEPVPPIESTVVLLAGRRKPWPERGEHRLSPPGAPFSGVSFRIDAVYQRTVAELEARGSALWMVFAPLAIDADPQRMKAVVERLRAEEPEGGFTELAAAMTVVAAKDGLRRGLVGSIMALLSKEETMRHPFFEWGKRDGKAEAEQHTVARLFEKRLGRPLDEAERAALLRRLATLGVDRLVDIRDDLAPDALAAWLREPDAA